MCAVQTALPSSGPLREEAEALSTQVCRTARAVRLRSSLCVIKSTELCELGANRGGA
jgi:hypothetical protein